MVVAATPVPRIKAAHRSGLPLTIRRRFDIDVPGLDLQPECPGVMPFAEIGQLSGGNLNQHRRRMIRNIYRRSFEGR